MFTHEPEESTWPIILAVISKVKDFLRLQAVTYTVNVSKTVHDRDTDCKQLIENDITAY